jgi:predicted metal-binding membrane protein
MAGDFTRPVSTDPSRIEKLLMRDRLIILLALAAIVAISWRYLAVMAANMQSVAQMSMPMDMPGMDMTSSSNFLPLFAMWAVMMVAMMLPSAAPTILLVLGVYRRRGDRFTRPNSLLFVAGYLLAWTAFSALAAGLQSFLHRAALLTPAMAARSAVLGGTILLTAGIYQWLPFKNSCLAHCHSPLSFLTHYWREGPVGALRMGLLHGLFCIGCCWALMALLFVAGVMNLLWVAAIAAFVLLEKLAPARLRLSRVAGTALMTWGAYVLLRAL